MKLAEPPEEQRKWMGQWRPAATALEEFHRREPHTMSDADAEVRIEAVPSLVKPYPRNSDPSGLVRQQAWFRRWHRHE